jgi:hypothetical protein
MYVQFTDDSQQTILGVFTDPQNPDEYPNQGEVEEDDQRYLAFINPPVAPEIADPLDKLKAFLTANPDVAAILK